MGATPLALRARVRVRELKHSLDCPAVGGHADHANVFADHGGWQLPTAAMVDRPRGARARRRSRSETCSSCGNMRTASSKPQSLVPLPWHSKPRTYYPDRERLAMDYATCVNEEVKALFAAGADVVQLDEPWLRTNPEEARAYAVAAINKALAGVNGTTALHLCFGYAAMVQGKPSQYAFLTELEDSVVQ